MKCTVEKLFGFSRWMLICTAFLFWGCEGEDSPDTKGVDQYFATHPYVSDPRISGPSDITISPESAFVSFIGQSIVFDASGGDGPYEWAVSYPDRGTVSVLGWSQGIYTAITLEENDIIVVDKHGHAAIAIITAEASSLVATATPSTLDANGDKANLIASGGVSPYTWTVGDVALGNVDSNTGNSVVYTRNATGDNSIRVTDGAGNFANIIIQQP